MHRKTTALSIITLLSTMVLPAQGTAPFVWTQTAPASPTTPPGRLSASLTWCHDLLGSVLFGGWNTSLGGDLADTWLFDAGAGHWRPLQPAPSPGARDSHAAAYDVARQRLVVFGGRYGTGALSDTWEYDPFANTWIRITTTTAPPARYGHRLVYDCRRGQVVMFGGTTSSNSTTFLSDTWTYDGANATWSRIPAPGPGARYNHGMVHDPVHDCIVLFGGTGGGAGPHLADTWEFSLATNTWRQVLPATAPPARTACAMVFDTVRGVVVLNGGAPNQSNGSRLADTWEYDAGSTDWVRTTPAQSPPARVAHGMSFDPAAQSVVLFGGGDNVTRQYFSGTWGYQTTKVTRYGVATPHCGGAPRIHTLGSPGIGNQGFGIRVTNALVSTPGLIDGVVLASLTAGTATMSCSGGGSLTLNVLPDPFSPVWVVQPIQIAADGEGRWPLPLPATNALRGFSLVFQFYESHASWGCPCSLPSGLGGSASTGLRITLY